MGPRCCKLRSLSHPLSSRSYCYWQWLDSLRKAKIAILLEVGQRAVLFCFRPSARAVFLHIRVVLVEQIKSIFSLMLACLRLSATFAKVRNLSLVWSSVIVNPWNRDVRELLILPLCYTSFSLLSLSWKADVTVVIGQRLLYGLAFRETCD